MSSFDGANFKERGRGGQGFPQWSARIARTLYHMPGGDTNVLLKDGKEAATLAVPVRCSSAELSALIGKVSVTGTLVLGSGDSRSATLLDAGEPEEVYTTGGTVYFTTLQFVAG